MIHCFDGEENCELSGSYTGLHSWNDAASCQSSDSIVTIGIRSIITNRSGKRGYWEIDRRWDISRGLRLARYGNNM